MSLRGDPSAHEYAQNVPYQGTCVNKNLQWTWSKRTFNEPGHKEPSMNLVTKNFQWNWSTGTFNDTTNLIPFTWHWYKTTPYSFPIIFNPYKTTPKSFPIILLFYFPFILNPTKTTSNYFKSIQNYSLPIYSSYNYLQVK